MRTLRKKTLVLQSQWMCLLAHRVLTALPGWRRS